MLHGGVAVRTPALHDHAASQVGESSAGQVPKGIEEVMTVTRRRTEVDISKPFQGINFFIWGGSKERSESQAGGVLVDDKDCI